MSIAIVLNGDEPNVEIKDQTVLCADGGFNHLPDGVVPALILGDCDSIKNAPTDVPLLLFPPEKNATDGELAIDYAVKMGETEINVYGAFGKRLDHTLGNLALLSRAANLGANAVIREKGLNVYLAKGKFLLDVTPGDLISTLPVGKALVHSYKNLKYPLLDLALDAENAGNGISNVATGSPVELDVAAGELLVFHYFN